MNSTIKPSSFRMRLLRQLAGGDITTIDDLQDSMGETRKKIQDNVIHACNDGLLKRMRDDVTGTPAYQITSKGREHIVSDPSKYPPDVLKDKTLYDMRWPTCATSDGDEPANQPAEVLESTPQTSTPADAEQLVYDTLTVPLNADQCAVFANGHLGTAIMPFADAQFLAMDNAKNGLVTTVYRLYFVGEAIPAPGADWIAP